MGPDLRVTEISVMVSLETLFRLLVRGRKTQDRLACHTVLELRLGASGGCIQLLELESTV